MLLDLESNKRDPKTDRDAPSGAIANLLSIDIIIIVRGIQGFRPRRRMLHAGVQRRILIRFEGLRMYLYISNDAVRNLLAIEDGLAAVESGYRAKTLGQFINLPRDNLSVGAGRKSLKVLSGALPSLGLMGLMSYWGGYDRRAVPQLA